MKKLLTLICALMCVCLSWAQDPDYFCISITSLTSSYNGTLKMQPNYVYENTDEIPKIQYKINNGTWNDATFSTIGGTQVSVASGDKIYFRAAGSGDEANKTFSLDDQKYFIKIATTSIKSFSASGNIMSLLDSEKFEELTTVPDYAFCKLLVFATALNDISQLRLPATSLGKYCYYSMFKSTNISETPDYFLPATTLSEYCYGSMFSECTSLVEAPELLANTLTKSCYNNMFCNCSNLKYIKVSFENWPGAWGSLDYGAVTNWVSGSNFSSTGVFICPGALDQTKVGTSNIPSGWEINKHDVSVSSLQWATAFIPFAATIDGGKAYIVTGANDGQVKMKEVSSIPANTAVLINREDVGNVTFNYTTGDTEDVSGNMLFGFLADTHVDAAANTKYYALNTKNDKVGFFVPKTTEDTTHPDAANGFTAKAGKAYLKVVSSGVAAPFFLIDDDATGIDLTTSEPNSLRTSQRYNLSGQAVSSDYKGVVIMNGKKVLNK